MADYTVKEINHRMYRIELKEPDDYLLFRRGSGDTIEIYDIAVNSVRGEGRGGNLLSALFDTLGSEESLVYAFVRSSNVLARQFYLKYRFEFAGSLLMFYDAEHEDASVYVRRLKER